MLNNRSVRKKNSQSGKKKNASGVAPWKKCLKMLQLSLIYLLALYGAHDLAGKFSSSYKDFAQDKLHLIVEKISGGAKSVEEKFSPLPAVTIKSEKDLRLTAYDNLALGVPSYNCDIIIDRPGFALGYSERYEQALWVSYKLTSDEVKSKKARRAESFRSDPLIPGKSASVDDYKNTAYDRGHLAPAADMSFSLQAMSESFLMSNISPQYPELNRGTWKKLEEKVRDYAVANGALYIVSGPVFDLSTPNITVGKNKVAVPDKYFKVLLDPNSSSPKAIGFVVNNSPREADRSLADIAVSVDAVEAMTGLDFFNQLDPADEQKLERSCDFQLWERSLPRAKRSR